MRWRKVFGIGLPKSGTMSLAHALGMCGLSVAHWPDVWRQRILWDGDWTVPPHLAQCNAFINFGEWWFARFERMYPRSGFVLTLRPIDQWLESVRRWLGSHVRPQWTDATIFGISQYDEVHLRWLYEAHKRAVLDYFADKDNLLIFESPYRWEPLCEFLGVPVPDQDYPRINTFRPSRTLSGSRIGASRVEAILDRLPVDRPIRGAEIGVLRGWLSQRLLEARPNLELILVDRWAEYEPDSRYRKSGDGNSIWTQPQWEQMYAQVRDIAMHYGRAEILRMDSVAAAAEVPDSSLDFAFVDADHSYEGCLADIRAWAPKIKPGGWIGGHDYNQHWGVPRAVDQWARERGVPIQLDCDSTWFALL